MRGIDSAVRSIVTRQECESMGMIGQQCSMKVHISLQLATFPRLKRASLDIEQGFIKGKILAIYVNSQFLCAVSTLVQPRSQTLTG